MQGRLMPLRTSYSQKGGCYGTKKQQDKPTEIESGRIGSKHETPSAVELCRVKK